jgi:hypothetical protein
VSAPLALAEKVVDALVERRRERFSAKAHQPYARTNAIASDLGDCDRALALGTLAWRVRPPLPPEAQERMESGKVQERAVLRQLEEEGWEIVEHESPIEIRDRAGRRVILRGKIDGKLVWRAAAGGRPSRIPLEIKDTSEPNFRRWQSVDDLRADRWSRKWWRQIQAYLLAEGYEWSLLILAHRGQRRYLPIPLDFEAAEVILRRLERNAELLQALEGDPLDSLDASLTELGLPYLGDPRGCSSCDFRGRVCSPPMPGDASLGELLLLEDDVGRLVSRHQELADAKREFDRLDRQLEKHVPRGAHAHAGGWIVTGRWEQQQTSATEAVPAKPAGTRKIWKRQFIAAETLRGPTATAESEEAGGAAEL